MALTPEGTPYVESTDLVANYPAASLSLANRVDLVGVLPFADSAARATAIPSPTDGQYSYLQNSNSTEFWNGSAWVLAGASGMTFITSSTFTTSSAVNINNCFTSTYENYFLLTAFTASSATSLSLRLRVSGADNTTANYNSQRIVANGATISGGGITAATSWQQVAYTGADTNNFFQLWVARPQTADNTTFLGDGISTNTTITELKSAGFFTATTQFDGISIIPVAGTITGTVRVYGLQNS